MHGQRVCRMHGGAAGQNLAAGDRRLAEQRARKDLATFGHPIVVDPHQALLDELHRTVGAVVWLDAMVAALTEGDVVAGVNVWVKLWHEERRHLIEVAKACVSAGIDERLVELEQARVTLQARAVQAGLDAAELTSEQRRTVITVMLQQLRAIEGDGGPGR